MFFLPHMMSSVIVLYILNSLFPTIPINPFTIIISMLFSYLPDIDSFWSATLKDHSAQVPHFPMFWIVLSVILYLLPVPFNIISTTVIILLLVQTVFHIIFDYITARCAGIMLFYPFSKRKFSFCKLKPSVGNFNLLKLDMKTAKKYIKFYVSNVPMTIFEIAIILVGLIILPFLFF